MDFPAWAQGIAALIGVPSVLVGAITGIMQIKMMRRDRLPIFEPNGSPSWLTPQYKDVFALRVSIDIRNPTQKSFIVESVTLRNPKGATIASPKNGEVGKSTPIKVQLDCPPGITKLVLDAMGSELETENNLSLTTIFSSKSGDIRHKSKAITIPIPKRFPN